MQISVFSISLSHTVGNGYKSAKIGTLIVVFNIDGFIVESVKIGQSAILNRWMFLL
jgi:hypothetical protein